MQTASDILGVPVPSDAPLFLMALGAHVAAGMTAVLSGAIAALAPKTAGLHPRAGLVYWASIVWVFISAIIMGVVRWPADTHLLVIGTVAFVTATSGLLLRMRRPRRWRQLHLVAMSSSFVALLTGFYVDNGPHLPVWRHLPGWAFWVLPAAIALPVTLRAYRRYSAPL